MRDRWNWYGAALALGAAGVALMPLSDFWKWTIGAALLAAAIVCFLVPHFTVGLRFPWSRISMADAATIAYGQLRGTAAGLAADRDGRTPLTWFSWALWQRLPLFGRWPPSRMHELVPWADRNLYVFEHDGSEIVLRSLDKSGKFEELQVRARDLRRAILLIRREINGEEV